MIASASLRRIGTVAASEYRQFVLTRTFLLLLLLSPGLLVILVGVTLIAETSRDLEPRKFAVVDRTGQVIMPLTRKADRRNQSGIYEFREGLPGVQRQARFLPINLSADEAEDGTLLLRLSDAVRRGEYTGFVVIEPGVLDPNVRGSMRYYSDNHTYSTLPDWLESALNRILQDYFLREAGMEPETVRKLTERRPLERFRLAETDGTGRVVEPEPENVLFRIMLPLGAMLLLFFCASMSSPIMLNSVMEERMQKIVEVLLASVKPIELMAGKLLGSVGVALTLGAIYLGPTLLFLAWRGVLRDIPVELWFWFPLFLLLTLLSMGSIWAAIGAACTELKDTQNFAGFAIVLLVLPVIFSISIVESPNTPFAIWCSLFPPFYPFLMTVRLCVAPGPQAWELWSGLFLSLFFTLLCVWIGARVFRRGLLRQGQTPSLAELWSWIRR